MPTAQSTTKKKIVLAALLHDIGKFWQRGDEVLKNSENIENKNREHLETIIPYIKDRPGYQHSIWTFQFFQNKKDQFQKLELWSNEKDSLINLASNHHRPRQDSDLQKLVQLADWWSSGIDRREAKPEEEAEESGTPLNWGKYAYKKIPLHSVFDGIHSNREEKKNSHLFPLKPLSIEDQEIAEPSLLNEEAIRDRQLEYKELWADFDRDFDRLPNGDFSGFITSLLSLLKKYTWCIPSSTVDMPNVSLYEHLKTTAAIGACLYDFGLDEKGVFSLEKVTDNATFPVLMCSVDLSGIQKFIYDVVSSKAFKSLKGRSYYLQILMDSLISTILSHPDITQEETNIIYASGGMAYLLLPNKPEVEKALTHIRNDFNQACWEEHKGRIFAAVGWVPFRYEFRAKSKEGAVSSPAKLSNGEAIDTLGKLWRAAAEQSALQKRQKFAYTATTAFESFFGKNGTGIETGGELQVCEVTGEPAREEELKNIGKGEERLLVLPLVEEQINLGNKLKDADFLLKLSELKLEFAKRKGYVTPARSKFSYFLLDQNEKDVSWLERNLKAVTVINDSDFLNRDKLPAGPLEAVTFNFYGGNRQPEAEEKENGALRSRPKTLEELCWIKEGEQAYSKLGILRMDVDDLGKIFIRGLPERDRSFASLATLSFLLDYFFSGYINTIRNRPEFNQTVSILYSGGDDLFAVGRWDSILDFAWEVRKAFAAFTGRPDISISGGVAIVDRKYPIYKAAELAGDAEKKAKEYTFDQIPKNALNFFGETVSWAAEFEEVQRLKDRMIILCEEQNLSRGLLQQLQRYKAVKNFNQILSDQQKEQNFSYKWHSVYYLKRLADRYRKSEEIQDFLSALLKDLMHNAQFGADRYFDLAALAARWVEYQLKDFSKTNIDNNG